MLTRDYFLRQINQIAVVLARVLFHKELNQQDLALETLRDAAGSYLGFSHDVLENFSEDALASLLKAGGDVNIEKSIIAALLLKEEADVHELAGDEQRRDNALMKSLRLLLESVTADNVTLPEEFAERVDALLVRTDGLEYSAGIERLLVRYFEMRGMYADAEDFLFHRVEAGDLKTAEDGILFYMRLLKKSDEELGAGNLGRGEVEDGLADLKQALVRLRSN